MGVFQGTHSIRYTYTCSCLKPAKPCRPELFLYEDFRMHKKKKGETTFTKGVCEQSAERTQVVRG